MKANKFSLREHSTDSATPPTKPFQVPTKEGNTIGEGVVREIEIEYYDVLYTKHIRQKQKIWEEGLLEHHLKGNRVCTFPD